MATKAFASQLSTIYQQLLQSYTTCQLAAIFTFALVLNLITYCARPLNLNSHTPTLRVVLSMFFSERFNKFMFISV